MKKRLSLASCAVTLMAGAMVLSSCSHDDATYSEENVQKANHAQAVANYEKAFVNLLGQPASNQCWDFTKGGSFTTTRSASENNELAQWPSYLACLNGYNSKYATGNSDPLPQGTLSSTVVKKANDIAAAIETAAAAGKIKTWAPTGNYVFRTVASFRNGSTFANNDKYYSIGANFGGKNHFIAMMGVKKNGKAVKNGSTGVQHTCGIVFGNVPSDAVWFAVPTSSKSASFKANSYPLTNYVVVNYEIGGKTYTFWGFRCDAEEDGGKYSDLILWVDKATMPKNKIIAKRYMVEDLGGDGESDIDFNDIVFDVEQFSDGSQKCIVRALGGTLPIKIKVGNSEWWSKPEPVTTMINTKPIDKDYIIAEFDVSGWVESSNNVQVMVEDKQGFEFVTTFPDNGKIPAMIAFSADKLWRLEKDRITDPNWFTSYPFEFNLDDYIQE